MGGVVRTACLWLILAVATPVSAQGLLLDDAAYNALPRQPDYASAGSKAEDSLLSRTPKVDLRPYCPRPQHQGAIGSCTGWSMGYGAMSILEAVQNGWAGKTDTITRHALSALYIYNQVKIGSCQSGAYLQRAAELVRDRGNIPSAAFDRFKNDCSQLPGSADSLAALPHRIKDFVALFGTDAPPTLRIEKTKLSLAQERPVVVSLLLRKNFESCTADPPYWSPMLGDTTFFGAHAMVVVGYDDGREAFEVLNSWGEQWGNGGFIWVKYADFARYCTYAIQLIPRAAPGEGEVRISGRLAARIPLFDPEDRLQFLPDSLHRVGDHYEGSPGQRQVGSLQQWHVPELSAGTYFYAFSMDADRRVRVHWPRDGQLDDAFSGTRESALMSLENIGVYLPGVHGALQFTTPGREYLVFLISRSPIQDLNGLLLGLQSRPDGEVPDQLRTALGDRLVDPAQVDFAQQEVAFTATMGEKAVLPVVVTFDLR